MSWITAKKRFNLCSKNCKLFFLKIQLPHKINRTVATTNSNHGYVCLLSCTVRFEKKKNLDTDRAIFRHLVALRLGDERRQGGMSHTEINPPPPF